MGWLLRVKRSDGPIEFEQFDDDELGTIDDKLTSYFIEDLIGVDKIILQRRDNK